MDVDRRAVLKLVGGGVVLAAAPMAEAMPWTMPDAAVEAWRNAGTDAADPRRWALSWALLAPSAHNRQSWIADLRTPDTIVLHVDTARLLPHTDPPGRQVTISQGTFLELLDLALRERGFASQIRLFPEGEYGERPDDRPVAVIRVVPSADPGKDPLLQWIARRRTNRNPYDTRREVPAEALAALAAMPRSDDLAVRTVQASEARQQLRDLAHRAWDIEVATERTNRESAELSRFGAAEIARHRDGISITGFMPWIASVFGFATVEKLLDPAGAAYRQTREFGHRSADTAMAWLWIASRGNTRAQQVAAGRLYVRLHLAATRAGLAWQPMSQIPQEYPEMAQTQGEFYRVAGVDPAIWTLQMLARVGYAEPVGPSPRRPIASILRH